jgi:hypothetical protein
MRLQIGQSNQSKAKKEKTKSQIEKEIVCSFLIV